ncbi:scavenger mRNA decapping enzyme c-term binding domain-containing protein [Rhizoctonia solani AG-1 IA]|uniref:Scavenger mRNA decapping enzyme c-term binding domain-containing protein n=1 Tax=Thanatephorus cucumeris (strain AG1-IA) TaxID=983506 RepID=L8WPY4_THACA|nr:scavenger mRNA decapping enzyme c-term binding domain-containing protein [Rhizoctonia solani AG-1 IA]
MLIPLLDPTSMLSCTKNQAIELKDDVHGSSPALKKCVFCDVRKELGFAVVYENEELIVFKDRDPAARHQVAEYLRRTTLQKYCECVMSGPKLLTHLAFRVTNRSIFTAFTVKHMASDIFDRFGFHIPPFNTVNHIHLHAQGLPYKNGLREKKYRMSTSSRTGKAKGFSWYAELGQCVRILESGNKVGVFPC